MKISHFLVAIAVCAAVIVTGKTISDVTEASQFAKLTAEQQAIVLGQREASRGLQTILLGAAALMLPISIGVVVASVVSMFRGNNINAPTLKLSGRGKSDVGQMEIENMPSGWMSTFPQQNQRTAFPPLQQGQFALSAPAFEEAPAARVLGGRS